MKTNTLAKEASGTLTTHEGATAAKQSAEKELLRAVSACLLWEDAFYETGSAVANRIKDLCATVSISLLADLAVRARTDLKLRHVPLWLCVHMLPKKGSVTERRLIGQAIERILQRADEPGELLSLYWRDGKKPLPRQLKNGIAAALTRFNAYQLAKYNRDSKVKLRDALFLSHAKPKDQEQAELWKKLIAGELESPDTWEVALSAGADKKETFTRLLTENKLGYMALLRNLRNMVDSNVDRELIATCLRDGAAKSKALPFRFIAAAKHAPKLEAELSDALVLAAEVLPKLSGRTLLVVDVSGSMQGRLSSKSEMNRVDGACGLSMLLREQSRDITVYATAGDDGTRIHATALVPSRRGFALADAIKAAMQSLGGGGIFLAQCMDYIQRHEGHVFDRTIVITDEQDCDIGRRASEAPKLATNAYIVNVGVYEPALPVTGAGWTRVCGFSERIIDWIMAEESTPN